MFLAAWQTCSTIAWRVVASMSGVQNSSIHTVLKHTKLLSLTIYVNLEDAQQMMTRYCKYRVFKNWKYYHTLSEKIAQSNVYLHLRQLCVFLQVKKECVVAMSGVPIITELLYIHQVTQDYPITWVIWDCRNYMNQERSLSTLVMENGDTLPQLQIHWTF